MSIRIWEDIVSQKKQVENQRENILNAFKQRKVADELGMVKAEKLFRPITKLLVGKKEEKNQFPDYDVDDQTRNFKNELPFGEGDYEKEMVVGEDPYADLKPFTEDEMVVPATEDWAGSDDEIVPLPEKSSPVPEEITPLPEELGEEVFQGEKARTTPPRYSATTSRDEPPKYKEPRADDSSDLSTLTKFLANNANRPNAIIKTKKSKFFGMDVEQARYQVRKIYTERAKKVLEKGDTKTTIGQKGLGPYEGKSNREMRAMIAEFEKGEEQTGTGLDNLVNRLSLGISSIFAGNTSVKLREEIRSIAKLLHQMGVISKEQKNKVLSLK